MHILKILFALSGLFYIFSVFFHKIYISKLKDNVIISHFVAAIAAFLTLYVLLGLVLFIFSKGLIYKAVILLFSASPFIIGKIATYEKEKIFTLIQFIIMLASVIFIVFF